MITSKATKRVDLPHEPGEWIDVRMPSLNILNRARQTQSRGAIELMQGVDMALLNTFGDRADVAAPRERSAEYDALTLLKGCITAWSYPEPLSYENIDELDEETVSAVVAVLLPPVVEEERKNGSGRSTKH